MLSEQETEAMHAMVNDFDRLIASKLPGYAVATYHLQRLATTTGDEWESVVRILLANHRSPTQETCADESLRERSDLMHKPAEF
jgi:hypothetical protein